MNRSSQRVTAKNAVVEDADVRSNDGGSTLPRDNISPEITTATPRISPRHTTNPYKQPRPPLKKTSKTPVMATVHEPPSSPPPFPRVVVTATKRGLPNNPVNDGTNSIPSVLNIDDTHEGT